MQRGSKTALGVLLTLVGGYTVYKTGVFDGLFSRVRSMFGADEITPANAQSIDIERTGITADVVPVSLVSSFMGYEFLDLAHTTAVVNDRPFGTGVTDQQLGYVNPYDLGYTDEELTHVQEFQAENSFTGTDPVGQLTRRSTPGVTSGDKIQHTVSGTTVSLDNATGATAGINYQGPYPCCLVPPEVNQDFPYAVSPFNPPFAVPPDTGGIGSNRFGSLTRLSDESTINGRFGKLTLSPDQDASYVASPSGETMPLSSWRTGYTIIQYSDTEAKAIPHGGGTELNLRRV